jgi:hypothetical protein
MPLQERYYLRVHSFRVSMIPCAADLQQMRDGCACAGVQDAAARFPAGGFGRCRRGAPHTGRQTTTPRAAHGAPPSASDSTLMIDVPHTFTAPRSTPMIRQLESKNRSSTIPLTRVPPSGRLPCRTPARDPTCVRVRSCHGPRSPSPRAAAQPLLLRPAGLAGIASSASTAPR